MIELLSLPIAAIAESPFNPRKTFNADSMAELVSSIKAQGVLQPILVRPLPGSRVADTARDVTHEIVAGHRRFRASSLAGLTTIPAVVRQFDDLAAMEAAILENLQRDDLTEMEEAEGYEHLMQHSNLTADQVGAKIGKSRSYVYARLKLTSLCSTVRTALREGKIDASKALLIARIPDEKLQLEAFKIVGNDNYSYREAAAYIQRNFMLRLDAARFKITDASLVPGAGSCKDCTKRTGHEPELFADVKSADVCTDPTCYRNKEDAHTDLQMQTAHANGQTVIDGREAKALMPHSWSTRVDGYLRLDDAADSPTAKPLRHLISQAMQDAGVQPTLVANPHKPGELVAVLLPEQVTPLLQAAGHQSAVAKIDSDAKADKKHNAEAAKEEAKREYESAWRWNVLEHAWGRLNQGDGSAITLPLAVMRHVAMGYAQALNTDNAKRLCKLLALGKVAPRDGIRQWTADTDRPNLAVQLFVMFNDVEYRSWMADDETNKGLLLIAAECRIDIEAIKAQTQANQREEAREEARQAAARKKSPAAKPNSTPSTNAATDAPAAPPAVGAGGQASKNPARPAARALKPKPTAEETMQGIAAAMQDLASGQSDACGIIPQTTAGEPTDSAQAALAAPQPGDEAQAPRLPAGAFAVGQRVQVLPCVPLRYQKWVGKQGTISMQTGPEAFDVTFKGRSGGLAGFHVSELEGVAA